MIGGVSNGAFAWWLLHQKIDGKLVVIVPEEEDVLSIQDDFEALFRLPPSWSLPKKIDAVALTADGLSERSMVLHQWLFEKATVLFVSKEGAGLTADSPETLRKRTFRVKPGLIIGRPAFEDVLARGGYTRGDYAENVGEYVIRGEVIDIWPPGEAGPVRITWNVDTVEAVRPINIYTQRSEGFLPQVMLYPITPGENARVTDLFASAQVIETAELNLSGSQYEAPPSFGGHTAALKQKLSEWHDQDWRVAIFCHNRGERDRLEELLSDPMDSLKSVKNATMPTFVIGELEHGFLDTTERIAVLSNSEIFGRYRKRIRLPRFEGGGGALNSPLDIKPNDFLVHEKHGIGRYQGLKPLKVGKDTSEYLNIEYKGGDRIYVPIFEIQQVQKYLGAEGHRPALSSLDTASWEKLKTKVKEDVAKLAAELLKKAAKRSIKPGHSFPVATHLEKEFAESFMYELTSDQKKTWEEVEGDMTAPKAMDRLICGDVGFGKTEIAMRAALKCALAGKQVAFLCPTTILAEQHARNFTERFADYPVTVSFLSRFQTKTEQKEILKKLTNGALDIVIGTHRLLSFDVVFKNLGLIIIDEEHRFGVRQKNKLLALRETVDVLSLTATPIPRTLSASLGGIKDLSVIETAPEGRLPISTHVGVFDEDLMVKAVQTELDRGGQVFYVHNRVKTLLARKKWLEEVLPSVRIGMVHGQMKEDELEEAMHGFLHRKYDLLLATTIIESGLDIPSVNTLVVEEAEELGLAQLYQLRGRVGRSRTRAACYLFYSLGGMTSDAKKRLEALREFTALGSGFRLAMRDMEIRGAGNLLGPQQHGNMAAVGIETYSRLLNEEIQRQRGKQVEDDVPEGGLALEISLTAYLPEDYLPSESERVQMYKRILAADESQLVKLKEELIDRCGPLPFPAKTLFDAAHLRLLAQSKGISEIRQETDDILLYFRPTYQLPDEAFQILLAEKDKLWRFIPGPPVGVRVFQEEKESGLDTVGRFLRTVYAKLEISQSKL